MEETLSKKIYVGNLQWKTTEDDLKELFSNYGNVISSTIITDRDTNRSRGFAFVEMENDEDADKAINELNNRELGGRNLRISEAIKKSGFKNRSFA
jgi:RNA recognition motif-containing protein